MSHSLRIVTLIGLTALVGCAPLPEDEAAQTEQSALNGPSDQPPIALPNPCLDNLANAYFAVPSPLTQNWSTTSWGPSVPGGLTTCDYRTVEFANVGGDHYNVGFTGISTGRAEFPDMTQADCEASTFSGWAEAFHPGVNGAPGSWEMLRNESSVAGHWVESGQTSSCTWDPMQGWLHYFAVGTATGVTRIRLGSRLKVRHGGVWMRHSVTTDGMFASY